MNIGIVILATNAYFVLGIRFIKKFIHHYKGDKHITFHFFSDVDPKPYLQDEIDVRYYYNNHNSWLDGTNSKFINMISLENNDSDYLIYFDADTNIDKPFDENWFIGNTVGLEHFGNRGWMKEIKGYDRNPQSKAYVPLDTPLPQMYFHGCLFGGKKDKIIEVCKILRNNQLEDKKISYEPGVNDERYINQYYHYNPPSLVVFLENYKFNVSDKGGMEDTRNPKLDIEQHKKILLENKNNLINIENNQIVVL